MDNKKKPVEEEKDKKEVDAVVKEPEKKIESKNDEAIQQCLTEKEDYKNKYLRALADFQNLERRLRDEKEQLSRMAKVNTVLAFLPFLDNLEKAEIFFKDAGLKMIKEQFFQSLKDLGIQEINVLNTEFDPHVAEVVEVVEGEKDNMVVEVLRKGFMLGEIVLRVAQVKVSKLKS